VTASAAVGADAPQLCIDCAYDLRAGQGDPVRCPECGALNWLDDSDIPAERLDRFVRRALKRLAAAVTLAAGMVVVGMPWIATELSRGALTGTVGACSVMVMLGFVWWWQIHRIGVTCGGHQGWRRWLLALHIVSLTRPAAIVAFMATALLAFTSDPRMTLVRSIGVTAAVCLALAVLISLIAGWRHADVITTMRRLLHREAIHAARRAGSAAITERFAVGANRD
jgi:hypothetical protein